jgi:hypothetical protein
MSRKSQYGKYPTNEEAESAVKRIRINISFDAWTFSKEK